MRPRKQILLVATNEQLRDQHALLLDTWHYAVAEEGTAADRIDVVLALNPSPEMVVELRVRFPYLPILCRLADPRFSLSIRRAEPTAIVYSSAELRERIQILAARKRGPKRVTVDAAVTSVPVHSTTAQPTR